MSEYISADENSASQLIESTVSARESIEASKHSREARAKRLKRIRKLTKKSRKSFAETYSISQGTLQNWETARFGGLTEKGARLIISALKKENIHCTFNWLMYGAGVGPQKAVSTNVCDLTDHDKIMESKKARINPNAIKIELDAFNSNHFNPITLKLTDDNMLPFFSIGETVGGEMIDPAKMDSVLNKLCIVKAEGHELMVRRVRPGASAGTYTLIATNLEKNIDIPVIYNVKITHAAQIIWARKEDI
jgi:DNA-binding transcriptional regulator YiaG